ncbi:ATP-binding protein [Paenibacillus sp. GSMTC-2017]|uniref:ATP-binding protein n=1 Tax=Paenibacillus sp. GSMTC-2017 TaxID=2794350 RepID=UPI001E6091CB|nr:ATP-binding protein [Paenibacillus sp. GSMTC-2017]
MTLFIKGNFPSILATILLFICGVFLLETEPIGLIISSSVLVVSGTFILKRLKWESFVRIALFSVLSVSIYLVVFITISRLYYKVTLPFQELVFLVAMTLLTSVLIPFLYLFAKNQVRLRRELILSEKNQSVGQLAASISHEIRNPLTTARGFLQLMNVDKLSKENFERYRKYALEGLDHANIIITEYLNFSKPNIEIAKRLDVKQEIESIVQWLQPYSVQMNILIVTHHMSEEEPFIKAESKQFQQCLLNIMKNAIESMTDGGLLTIHTQIVENQVQILIRDTGIGMSSEQLKRIGKPYFTTKESGTGLGLMVVMNLVKAMDGKILFRSKLNQGTICEIHLEQLQSPEIKEEPLNA